MPPPRLAERACRQLVSKCSTRPSQSRACGAGQGADAAQVGSHRTGARLTDVPMDAMGHVRKAEGRGAASAEG